MGKDKDYSQHKSGRSSPPRRSRDSSEQRRHQSPIRRDMPPPWRVKEEPDTESRHDRDGSDNRRNKRDDNKNRDRGDDDRDFDRKYNGGRDRKNYDRESSRKDDDRERRDSSCDRDRKVGARDGRDGNCDSDRKDSGRDSRDDDREGRKREIDKKSSRDRIQSSSSSSSSNEDERRKQRESKSSSAKEILNKKKAIKKATETPEEKRYRRLQKKEAKERVRREKMGWDREYLGYTNDDNPFGDHQLSEAFVWKKKLDMEGKGHLTYDEVQQLQRRKMETTKEELESVRRRRMEREREREERDKDIEMTQRDKELEYFRVWEHQEDKFHLDQAKLRSRIRIADGRAKPIDLLSKYISDQDVDVVGSGEQAAAAVVEMHEPTQFLVGLTANDLEDLIEDVKVVYMELEQGKNAEYWRDITVVVEDELKKLRELDADLEGGAAGGGGGGAGRCYRGANISEPVLQDIAGILRGKTYSQLSMLDKQVEQKLQGGEGIDIAYWETLLQRVRAQMARTRLRERHQETLRRKLEQLKQEQGILSEPLFPSASATLTTSTSGPQASTSASSAPTTSQPVGEGDESVRSEEDGEEEEDGEGEEEEEQATEVGADDREIYDSGRYSPVLLRSEDLDLEAVVYEPAEEKQKLAFEREQVLRTGRIRADAEDDLMRRARDGMTDDEVQFSVQVPLEDQSFLWSDKYRPRKPRFFNRVHTGFEWNKYNQTHYDMDNPPPKVVQGYKFNIFYPDLIDKTTVTPSYQLIPVEGEPQFMLLRFSSGPPYEDIAFKIVSREWENSYKHGFRCQFQNNIFQLWFHFKRYRYRR